MNWNFNLKTHVSRPAFSLGKTCTAAIFVAGLAVVGSLSGQSVVHAQGVTRVDPSLQKLLFTAVRNNNFNAARSIIDAGADVSQHNSQGFTPFDIAIRNGFFDVAQHLVLARRLQQKKAAEN